MMHIPFAFFGVNTVEKLLFRDRSERCDRQHLGLSSAEQAGTVNAGEKPGFRIERTDFFQSSAVNALMLFEQHFPNDHFFGFVNRFAEGRAAVGIFLGKFFFNRRRNFRQPCVADIFVVGVQRVPDHIVCEFFDVAV